jgi:polysaccharide biosynthesis/export protein
MRYIVLNLNRACILTALAIAVTACGTTVTPGISFSQTHTQPSSSGSDMQSADTQPATAFKEITPQLVKAEQALRNSRAAQDLGMLITPPEPYLIESGDVLSIVVWDHPELTTGTGVMPPSPMDATSMVAMPAGFMVDHEGHIQFPYAGKLKVAGLTSEAARSLLGNKLARYIAQPNITLKVQLFRSKRIYVDGEVKMPGVHNISDIPMTLLEAINRAGGTLPSADQSRIALVRDGVSYMINLPEMVQRGFNPAAIVLRNGDVLRVRSRDETKVFVSGEVVAPRALTMHNGRLSLNEALGESGGVNPLSGDASQIYVVRRSGDEPIVFRLDARAPGAFAMAENFDLDPKDVVYVAATPLTNWHRTISQMLPGALSSAASVVTRPN